MRIPPEKIEEIRSSNDIIDVISQHVHLKKRGKNFVGLCPFHQEKTPSFTVSPEKQVYHCFGCGKGGNVYTFVMEFEKVSFTEAVRSLAEKVGITIRLTEADEQHESEAERLYSVCRFAGLFFYNNLTKAEEGKTALDYFHGRGFSDETIRVFGLGYALNSWEGLLTHAKAEGFSREDLLKAGLIRTREDGSDYDYFRGRAMFPIFSTSGRVLGFGARKLREDDPLGKYINSPETLIYNKSRVLFGLFHSKDAIRSAERALMVEGYADLISLYQAGIQNVVASSGTALTEEQVQLIGRYTKKLTLVYDADSAGSSATLRGMDIVLAQDLDVAIVELPEGEDPDSFVRKFGGKEFLKLSDQAISFIDFKAGQFRRAGAFTTPEGKAQAVRSIVQSIAKMKDELKRNFYIKDVASKYDLYESVLYRELDRWREEGARAVAPLGSGAGRQAAGESRMRESEGARSGEAIVIPPPERDLLKLLLEHQADLISFVFSHITLPEVCTPQVRHILEMLLARYDERGPMHVTDLLLEIEDPLLKSIITDVVLSKYELSKQWQAGDSEFEEADPWTLARDAIVALKKQNLKKEVAENQRLLKETSLQGGDTKPLIERHQELEKQLRSIESPEFLKQA